MIKFVDISPAYPPSLFTRTFVRMYIRCIRWPVKKVIVIFFTENTAEAMKIGIRTFRDD